jgi:membrane protease YdiL (CAAX protease family)
LPSGELRISLLLTYITVVGLDLVFDASPWILAVVGVAIGLSSALIHNRPLVIALLVRWKTPWLPVAPFLSLAVWALLDVGIQTASALAMQEGGFSAADPPLLFSWLLALRAHFEGIHPVMAGISGGLLLGIGEEVFWRGFVMTRLMVPLGHGGAAAVSAVLFGLYYYLVLGPLAALWALFFGLIASLLTLRAKSLLPAVAAHVCFLVLALWLQPDVNALIP